MVLKYLAPIGGAAVAVLSLWLYAGHISDLRNERDQVKASLQVLNTAIAETTVALERAANLAETQRRREIAFRLQLENVLSKTYGGCVDAPVNPDLLRDLDGLRPEAN